MSEKIVYLIGGPNGSGKTTLAKQLLYKYPDLNFMNADEIAIKQNLSVINAGRAVLKEIQNLLNNGKSFIWETTLSGMYHIKFIDMARQNDYKIMFSYVMLASPEQNIARVQQRVALGGHDVPEDVLRRRWVKSMMNIKFACQMSDSWILYYNGDKSVVEFAHSDNDGQIFITNDAGYKQYCLTYKQAQEEIIKLANRGAKHAQRIAREAGINPVFQSLETMGVITR